MTQRNAAAMMAAQPATNPVGLVQWVNHVRPQGDWDFKYKADQDGGRRGYYFFGDQLFSAEGFGNIHYGYVGTADGFGAGTLNGRLGQFRSVQESHLSTGMELILI